MKNEVYFDKTANTIRYACGPDSAEETMAWHDKCYEKSILHHTRIIEKIMKMQHASPFFLSFYPLCQPMNSLEKKQGMARIFGQQGICYAESGSMILPYDRKGTNHLVSVANARIDNLDILFYSRVSTILCFPEGCAAENLLTEVRLATKRETVLSYLGAKYLTISFLDVGCDGNSILIHINGITDGIDWESLGC